MKPRNQHDGQHPAICSESLLETGRVKNHAGRPFAHRSPCTSRFYLRAKTRAVHTASDCLCASCEHSSHHVNGNLGDLRGGSETIARNTANLPLVIESAHSGEDNSN